MRIRLQLLLPLAVAIVVAAAFVVAAVLVGDAVRSSLVTVPGLTSARAAEAAVRVIAVAGVIGTAVATVAAVVVARMVVAPLSQVRANAARLIEEGTDGEPTTPLSEIKEAIRGMTLAAGELRDRRRQAVRAESELARLVEAVSEGIIQLDGDGRVTRLNRSSRDLLRLPDDAVGRPIGALFRTPGIRRILAGAARGASGSAEVAVDERRVLVSAVPLEGGGAVATFVDLTDLRRLEEVRRDFVANASHELKTPLTSIRGYTETLLFGELPDPERTQFLETIARNTERLQRIVDDLLDLSRLEAGRWEPDLAPVDVAAAARTAWRPFADRADARRVAFETRGAGRAVADRRGLEQVFANLFDNGLRHTDAGGRIDVAVEVRDERPGAGARRAPSREGVAAEPEHGSGDEGTDGPGGRPEHAPENGWVVIEVADTGSGIARDALPRIFERFYRVDPARSRAEGGTGLGLSIVRHMLESMGGGVDARSELGKGTVLRVWLPAAP